MQLCFADLVLKLFAVTLHQFGQHVLVGSMSKHTILYMTFENELTPVHSLALLFGDEDVIWLIVIFPFFP